jgi:hypothetical protein
MHLRTAITFGSQKVLMCGAPGDVRGGAGRSLQTFKYNTLELVYLFTAMFILLAGVCAALARASLCEPSPALVRAGACIRLPCVLAPMCSTLQ